MNHYLDMTKEQFKAFRNLEINSPLCMLNLLKFKKEVPDSKMSGADAYEVYMKAAQPFFEKSNAKIIYYGKPQFTLIGPSDEALWDKILLVEYAQKSDFINMIMSEGYPAHLRNAALEDSRLIFCKQ